MMHEIIKKYYKCKHAAHAKQMSDQLKGDYQFLGIQPNQRKQLTQDHLRKLQNEDLDFSVIAELYQLPEREFQYLAIEYLTLNKKQLTADHIGIIETLITTKSWWDTVDFLATSTLGYMALNFPEIIVPHIDRWAKSSDIWLVRAAILHQVKYKEKTNKDRLASYIIRNKDSEDLFVNKAIGWALREYAKTDAPWVIDFIKENPLNPIALKEAQRRPKKPIKLEPKTK